jgi:hypothetical protein
LRSASTSPGDETNNLIVRMPANGRFPEAERYPATVLNKYFDLLYTGLHIALRQHIAGRSGRQTSGQ